MPTIKFRAKIEPIYEPEGDAIAYELVKVPDIKRSHCDMAAFRKHKRFGPYANSDLFANLLAKHLRTAGIKSHLRLDRLPETVSVDRGGFLAQVTIHVGD